MRLFFRFFALFLELLAGSDSAISLVGASLNCGRAGQRRLVANALRPLGRLWSIMFLLCDKTALRVFQPNPLSALPVFDRPTLAFKPAP